jgi:hypothetical protein
MIKHEVAGTIKSEIELYEKRLRIHQNGNIVIRPKAREMTTNGIRCPGDLHFENNKFVTR